MFNIDIDPVQEGFKPKLVKARPHLYEMQYIQKQHKMFFMVASRIAESKKLKTNELFL